MFSTTSSFQTESSYLRSILFPNKRLYRQGRDLPLDTPLSPTTSNLAAGRFYRRRERRAAVSRRLLRTPSFTSSTDERGDGDRRCQPSSLAAENLVIDDDGMELRRSEF
ncbi:hypothetical protein F2Q68_00028059 [Brassica cretica]|uniref:Uncharacterized protein n=1 Tax=Brassica cretica TaxID=69181 RepID=A0A8S9IE12_BRACR|nr:hypothetical protein F2Q68_00028059 [Brassica cretica]